MVVDIGSKYLPRAPDPNMFLTNVNPDSIFGTVAHHHVMYLMVLD